MHAAIHPSEYPSKMTHTKKTKRIQTLFLIISTVATLVLSPLQAHAIDQKIDVSQLKMPAGMSLSVDKVVSEYGGSNLYLNLTTPTLPDKSLLKVPSLKITGSPSSIVWPAEHQEFFYINPDNPQLYIRLAETDITQAVYSITISGTATLETRSDLLYPASYSPTISAFAALGLEVTGGNKVYVSDGTFGIYVMAKTKSGIDPVNIIISSSSVTALGLNPIPLTLLRREILVGATPVEIDLGSTNTDLWSNLKGSQVNTSVRVISPSTIENRIVSIPGLTSGEPSKVYYDLATDTSSIYLELKNTGTKALNFDQSGLKVIDLGTGKTVATLNSYAKYVYSPVATKGNEEGLSSIFFEFKNDFSENKKLAIIGTIKPATPSSLDTKGFKIPSGFKIDSPTFYSYGYDEIKKLTSIYVTIKKTGKVSTSLALSELKIPSGKIDKSNPFVTPYFDEPTNVTTYTFIAGTIKGDVRSGKKLSASGKVSSVVRTEFSQSTTLDSSLSKVLFDAYSIVEPEYWVYDSKKKTTTVQAYFGNSNIPETTIYACNFIVKLNEKNITQKSTSFTIKKDLNGPFGVAIIPGDVRVKAGIVNISGQFSASKC